MAKFLFPDEIKDLNPEKEKEKNFLINICQLSIQVCFQQIGNNIQSVI